MRGRDASATAAGTAALRVPATTPESGGRGSRSGWRRGACKILPVAGHEVDSADAALLQALASRIKLAESGCVTADEALSFLRFRARHLCVQFFHSPLRPRYEAELKEMAAEAISIRRDDGLWSAGLLDKDSYPLPEVSGSAFITFALAWGVNEKILDKKTYEPAVEKAWGSMLTHVYADGRLSCIQPVGGSPGPYMETSSYTSATGRRIFLSSSAAINGSTARRSPIIPSASATVVRMP